MAIRDWSQTAASNTSLEGITVAEGQMAISSFNNALRAMAAAVREVQASATIASAATCNIGAANAEYLDVTGTTAITAFDNVAAGVNRQLRFAGILTLTHNATSLILPTGANITTAAGDVAEFRSLGSGNWRCVWYSRASGVALATTGGTVTSVVAGAGLSGGTITTNGTIAVDINSLTEDIAPDHAADFVMTYDASAGGLKKGRLSAVSALRQIVIAEVVGTASASTLVPNDDTIPQSGEGDQILSGSITLANAANKVRVRVCVFGSSNANRDYILACFRGGTSAIAATAQLMNGWGQINLEFTDTPGSVGPHTYTLRLGPTVGDTFTVNGTGGSRRLGGVAKSVLVLEEYV